MTTQSKVCAFLTTLLLALAIGVPCLFAQPVPKEVFPPDSSPYGRSYGEWAAAWQQWAIGIPASAHPLFDTPLDNPVPASTAQSGPVFFLGGKFCRIIDTTCGANNVQRTAYVPAGKAILIPIANSEWSTVETGGGNAEGSKAIKDMSSLRKLSADWIDSALSLSFDLDGVSIPESQLREQFRFQSPAFEFYLPADDIFAAVGEGKFRSGYYFPGVDDGYYVMLKPLDKGQHVIHFAATFTGWALDITYTVIVQ